MKSKVWIGLLAALFVVCLGLSIFLLAPGEQAYLAEIYSDGKLIKTVSLATAQQFTVKTEHGTNIVTVKDGKIAVTQADCPDGYCMKRGFCDGGAAIVCLPNKLVIEFVSRQDIDGAIG